MPSIEISSTSSSSLVRASVSASCSGIRNLPH
jgi:hypothetical protein